MVYFGTLEEWQKQSSLLLQARPTTARIITKYKIPNLDSPKYQKSTKRKRVDDGGEKVEGNTDRAPRAVLVLKTRDDASGVCLKFKTDKAADVGRLINGLGGMGRHMAAMPEKPDVPDPVADEAKAAAPSEAPSKDTASAPTTHTGGGGGKKKKKGKK